MNGSMNNITLAFLSTPSARRATWDELAAWGELDISIHALREEGDLPRPSKSAGRIYFYPRPPRGGRRLRWTACLWSGDFYPRPPRGGRPDRLVTLPLGQTISIHALREEGDGTDGRIGMYVEEFLSTPSARRATQRFQ